jgi:hypothetical protein
MASFNIDLANPQAQGATPVAPVESEVGISRAFQDLSTIFVKNAQEHIEKSKENFAESIHSEYVRAESLISEGVDQGALSPSEAAGRSRALFNKFAAQYPNLIDRFAKSRKALVEHTSIGEAVEEEQASQDRTRQLKKDAQASGMMIREDYGPAFVNAQLDQFQATRIQEAQLQAAYKQASEARAMSSEERTASDYALKQQTSKVIVSLAQSGVPASQEFIRGLSNKVAQGVPVESLALDVSEFFSNYETAIAAASTLNPETGKALNNVFGDLRATAENVISGKLQTDALESRLSTMKNRLQIIALTSDPRMQATYASTAIAGGNLLVDVPHSESAANDLMKLSIAKGGLLDLPNIFDNSDRSQLVFNNIKRLTNQAESGSIEDPEKAKSELENAASNTLFLIGEMNPGSVSADRVKEAAAYYASPEFLKLSSSMAKDPAKASRMGEARQVLQLVYDKEIIRGVAQELSKPFKFRTAEGSQEARVMDIMDIQFTGAGVRFVPKMREGESGFDRQDRKQWASELNRSTKAVNQLIHMGAHLEGRSDYGKYWEENKHAILPNYFPSPSRIEKAKAEGYEYDVSKPWSDPSAWVKRNKNE